MTDYSKWDKLEDSDDESAAPVVAAPAAPAAPTGMPKAEAMRLQAHALMENGKFAEGATAYKDLLAHAPTDAPAIFIESCRMNLAIALIKQDLHHEVVPLCSEILKVNPALHKALHFRGHAFMQMGFVQDAENDLKAASEGMPGDEGVAGDLEQLAIAQAAEGKMKELMGKANEAFQAENLDDTVTFFKQALEEAKKVRRRDACGAINGSIGMALFKQDKHREAIPHFVQALQDMPHPERRMEFLEALSACHTVLGEAEMCVKALEGAIMIGVQAGAPPQRMVKLLLHAARSCGMLKQTEEGLKYVKKAKEIATMAQQWDIVFQCNEWIARLHTENQQPDLALASITEAFQEACARVDLKSAIALMYIQMHVLKITDPMKHINLVQSTHAFFVSQKEFKGVLSCLEVLVVHGVNAFKSGGKDPKQASALDELWDEVRALPYEPMENEEKFLVLKLLQLQADFYIEFDTKANCKTVLHEMLDRAHAMKPIPPQHVIAEVFKKLTALSEEVSEQRENLLKVEASLRQFKADVETRIENDQKDEILAKISSDIADTLCNKAYCEAELGEIDQAEKTLAECSALCDASSIQNGRIQCLTEIATGILALKRGNKDAAEAHFANGLAAAEASKDDNVVAQVRELVNDARQKGGLPVATVATPVTPTPTVEAPKSAQAAKARALPAKKTYPGAKVKKTQSSSLVEYIPLIVFMLFLAIFFQLVSQ
ncbi:hypothetical protein SDRG_09519 [Saprolegnia diclina VS20]|uniref:Uncharacterized protein n=1 Tax=Saprolegnia diclina (strain VS20) TaxID=1156394 RepID=T0RSB6_SAPDV|nr:hypothetical protein SDRG_09519 [Saprolegnia diclina VS20]EQC32997.1 hypothetical protein SDRG_09519 [Saprolegnia diclina VS20]|eukprot:XP_008613683.1 hypothetical protein SDRG_09519 [Saprolegnia diclina VS20]